MSKCQRHFVNVMHKETSKKQNQAHLHQLKKFPNGTSTRKIKSISGLDQQQCRCYSAFQTHKRWL